MEFYNLNEKVQNLFTFPEKSVYDNMKETKDLSLDSTKSKTMLRWKPKYKFDEAFDCQVNG